MEIPIALLIIWLIVMLVGHGSWVMVRAIFRLFSGATEYRNPPYPLTDEKADIAATRRVIGRMTSRNLLDESVATKLRDQLRNLEQGQTTGTIHPVPQQPVDLHDNVAAESAGHQQPLTTPVPADESPAEEAILATLADTPSDPFDWLRPDYQQPPSQPIPTQPAAPILSKSELIQSFLAAHNIRWGELVAGMLIVICSIGLVISLWNTLVQTHRVIPSLIFLGANAAIYAAGLYTLSRWRLRHTSRAVLVIATLLVPLSVLAGLAAAGTGASAVQLNDPITLAAIGLASAIYIFLLYRSGTALSRRTYAIPMAISVAGPVAVLPLVPAAVRSFGSNAGWIIGIGSIAVMLALFWMIRLHKRENLSLGVAGGRTRLLVMAFGIFSLAVSIGYLAFALRGGNSDAMLPIGIATIPAMIALAGASRSLMTAARSNAQSMAGAVLCVILIGMAWTILPPAMAAAGWVWSWAFAFSISAAFVGWFFRQPRWLPLATLPLGMAATFSSPVWLGDQSWGTIGLSSRLFGGEPMIAATLVAIAAAAITLVIRDPIRRKWMGYAAVTWTVVALTIATALSVAPLAKLGVAPWWSVILVLAAGSIASVFLATRHQAWAFATIGTVTFGWLSVFRPIQWDTPLADASPKVWMMTFVAITATMLVLRELAPRLAKLTSGNRRITRRSGRSWEISSSVAALIAGVIACASVQQGWGVSAVTLASVSALVLWLSTASRSIDLLRVAQLATIALAIVVGYGRFGESLFDKQAWQTATAPWAWAIVAVIVTGFWLAIRQSAAVDLVPLKRRLKHLTSSQAVPSLMPDGWVGAIGAAFVSIGSAWTFTYVLAKAAGSNIVTYQYDLLLPVTAILGCGIVTWWTLRQLRSFEAREKFGLSDNIASSLIVAGLVWGSCQVAHLIFSADDAKLVVATTLVAAGCVGLSTLIAARSHLTLPKAFRPLAMVVGLLVLAMSSAVLLMTGWVDPILDKTYADAFSTLSVTSWWTLAAAGLLWKAKQTTDSVPSIASALLTPAAAALVVPVFSLSHPVVWVQVASIASMAWVGVTRIWLEEKESHLAQPAINGSMWFAIGVGVVTSMLVTLSIVLKIQSLNPVFGLAGLIISVLSVVLWCLGWVRLPSQSDDSDPRLPWPIGVSILAGQFAWLAYWLDLVSGVHVIELIPAVWGIAAAASLVRYRIDGRSLDFIHVGLVTVAVAIIAFILDTRSELMPWLALAVLAIGGLLVAFVGSGRSTTKVQLGASRLLGWYVVGAGGLLLVGQIAAGMNPLVQWTMLVIWPAVWVVAWRLICPEMKAEGDQRRQAFLAIPDTEFAVLLLVAVIVEVILFTLSGRHRYSTSVIADPLLWSRVAAYIVVGCSTITRASRNVVWTCGIGTLVAMTSLVAVELAIHYDATSNQRFMWAALPSGFAIAFISHWLPALARLVARIVGESPSAHLRRLVQSTWQVALVVAGIGGTFAAVMIFGNAPAPETQLTIITVALAAWAIAEMAQACDSSRLRHAAVTVALITIGLWASVDSGETSHPLSDRLNAVAGRVGVHDPDAAVRVSETARRKHRQPLARRISPRCDGRRMRRRRFADQYARDGSRAADPRRHRGYLVADGDRRRGHAVDSECFGRIDCGPQRPRFFLARADPIIRPTADAADHRRTSHRRHCMSSHLVVQKLVIPRTACYWPYIVMALAFLSVGATQWARRREDHVMSKTLSQSALYLPLIPVVGFWLSGSINEFSWAFKGDKVRYDLLLAIGSVYYIGISAMWKGVMPRIAAVVLGNAAWWVVLVQQPGWSFLAHPQAWLIPPAVCVLVVAHLYRERLEPAMSSGIRYAATLVIYISSTADILLQQIGTNIYGPIVLVVLALAGMAAGVVLRVRPFLYLGAMFVFIGVTSMVWHAHKSIDAVWPWWVFGITTGICLLAGLMAIEKNKPKLREYANNLATWQG